MHRLIARVLLALAVLIPTALVPAAPASAGDGYWSPGRCHGVQWKSTPGWYVEYWSPGWGGNWRVYWSSNPAESYMHTYANADYECGPFGPPKMNRTYWYDCNHYYARQSDCLVGDYQDFAWGQMWRHYFSEWDRMLIYSSSWG